MKLRSRFPGFRRQTGALPIGTICILIVFASIVTLALKLGPHYIEFRTIQSIINQLPRAEVNTMARADVFDAIQKRLPLNSIYDVQVRDIIQFDRGPETTTVTLAYEKREPLFLNIDVVIKFDKQFEFR
jgi:hypothetical protein